MFASMANHPMLKRHATSIGQDGATGAGSGGGTGGAGAGAGMMSGNAGGGVGRGVPGDLNNNGPQTGANSNSPFGAGANVHLKNSLGASS